MHCTDYIALTVGNSSHRVVYRGEVCSRRMCTNPATLSLLAAGLALLRRKRASEGNR